jgi:hypothetical protein
MKIQIDLERPSWFVRSPRWAKLLVVASLALVTVAVPAAWASDRFIDVPNTNPHHDDINAIATAGITRGCNPPTNDLYCPGDTVRRDQMASFLQRGLGRAGRNVTISSGLSDSLAAVNSVTITAPGSGFVLVTATGTPQSSTVTPCSPCKVEMRVSDPASGQASQAQVDTVAVGPGGNEDGGMGVTWLFPVTGITTPTARMFNVDARRYAGTGTVFFDSTVTALWVPFGSTGGSTLSVQSGPPGRSEP